MATVMYKYVLNPYTSKIQMPKNAEILHVVSQQDKICLWAEIDPSAEPEYRFFEVFGTGRDIPAGNRKYFGTVKMSDDQLIFHVYEKL